ncbi:MAG TPA: amino acid transporter, partial [Amycolatopsis sp.]|nr:amino acid transporter [Amycolatopsis sp.]
YVLLSLWSANVLADSVSAVGLTIAIEYGMTALACVWVFRKTLFASVRNFFFRGLFPLLGGLFFAVVLVAAAVQYAQPDGGSTTVFGVGGVAVIGVVAIFLGVPLMLLLGRRCRDFFAGRRLRRGFVPLGGESVVGLLKEG